MQHKKRVERAQRFQAIDELNHKREDLMLEQIEKEYFYKFEKDSERMQYMTHRYLGGSSWHQMAAAKETAVLDPLQKK
eukprot:gene18226-5782_t